MPKDLKLAHCTCQRCGYIWIPRTPDPRLCPNCNTARWDTPRKAKVVK